MIKQNPNDNTEMIKICPDRERN